MEIFGHQAGLSVNLLAMATILGRVAPRINPPREASGRQTDSTILRKPGPPILAERVETRHSRIPEKYH